MPFREIERSYSAVRPIGSGVLGGPRHAASWEQRSASTPRTPEPAPNGGPTQPEAWHRSARRLGAGSLVQISQVSRPFRLEMSLRF